MYVNSIYNAFLYGKKSFPKPKQCPLFQYNIPKFCYDMLCYLKNVPKLIKGLSISFWRQLRLVTIEHTWLSNEKMDNWHQKRVIKL